MAYQPPLNGGRINASIGGNSTSAGAGYQLISTGTLNLMGGNNITLSQNGNSISIVGGAAGGGAALSAAGNSISNGTAVFSNSNGVGFGMAGSTITASHNGLTSQSNQALSASNGSFAFQTAAFSDANGVTFGTSAGSIITASVHTTYAGSNHSHGNPTLALTNLAGTTASASNGLTISLSATSQSVQTQNMFNLTLGGNSTSAGAGYTQISSGTLTLAGGNNITLSQNGNAITISGGAGGGGGVALYDGANSISSGTARISASGALTASVNGQTLNFSVPATSSLSGTGGVSISTNGSTVFVGAPSPGTLSRWEYPREGFTTIGAHGQGSLSVEHMYVPFNVTGSAMKIGGSISAATNTSVTTASANISLWMGIYTLNGSTLSLASSGSANNGFAWSVSNSSTANSSVNSMRQMTVPMNINMTPGEYWVGAVISSATTYTSAGFTMYGNNLIASAANNAVLAPIGSDMTNARDVMLYQGIYVAQTSAGPVSIGQTQINNTSASNVQKANFYNVIYNATY